MAQQQQQTNSRKRVRFATAPNGEIKVSCHEAATPLSTSPRFRPSKFWWQSDEIVALRTHAHAITELVKSGGCDLIWEKATKTTYIDCMRRAYFKCDSNKSKKTKMLIENLSFWLCIGHSRRGLERFILEDMRICREEGRQQLWDHVLDVQDECYDNEDVSVDETWARVQQASSFCSQSAERFAQLMGQADALAVQMENELQNDKATSNTISVPPLTSSISSSRKRKTRRSGTMKKSRSLRSIQSTGSMRKSKSLRSMTKDIGGLQRKSTYSPAA